MSEITVCEFIGFFLIPKSLTFDLKDIDELVDFRLLAVIVISKVLLVLSNSPFFVLFKR